MVDSLLEEPFGRFVPFGLTDRLIRLSGALPSSWVGMRGSFLVRKLATRLLGGRPIDATRFGARMRLQPYANTCEKRIASRIAHGMRSKRDSEHRRAVNYSAPTSARQPILRRTFSHGLGVLNVVVQFYPRAEAINGK